PYLSPWFEILVNWPVSACTLLSANQGVKHGSPAEVRSKGQKKRDLRVQLMLNWNSDPGEKCLSELPLEYHRPDGGPERVCDDVRHARVSSRNEALKGFDCKTDRKSEENGYQPCAIQMQYRREISMENKAERDETSDVDQDVLIVAPTRMIFLPRDFQQRRAHD